MGHHFRRVAVQVGDEQALIAVRISHFRSVRGPSHPAGHYQSNFRAVCCVHTDALVFDMDHVSVWQPFWKATSSDHATLAIVDVHDDHSPTRLVKKRNLVNQTISGRRPFHEASMVAGQFSLSGSVWVDDVNTSIFEGVGDPGSVGGPGRRPPVAGEPLPSGAVGVDDPHSPIPASVNKAGPVWGPRWRESVVVGDSPHSAVQPDSEHPLIVGLVGGEAIPQKQTPAVAHGQVFACPAVGVPDLLAVRRPGQADSFMVDQ